MGWLIALDMARNNKANRALQKSNRIKIRERLRELQKGQSDKLEMDPRFLNRTKDEIKNSINNVRHRVSKEYRHRIFYTVIAVVILLIVLFLLWTKLSTTVF